MDFAKYLGRKAIWYVIALFVALLLNFLHPRLIPGNPVDTIVSQMARGGGASGEQMKAIYAHYMQQFGLDKPMWEQFLIYLGHVFRGDLGFSFALWPASVRSLIGQALPWSIALQLPALLIGWIVGNLLGAVAAYKSGWFDRGAFLGSLFASSMPYYCLAIILLYVLAVAVPVLPPGGGYSYGSTPELSTAFVGDALQHYWLPFLSLVVVFIGGQAVGMRSMAIYELGSDYVNYGRGLGLRDRTIVRYIFRNAMLPQITALALAPAAIVTSAIIVEGLFGLPGIGSALNLAIRANDFPTIYGIVVFITIAVAVLMTVVEFLYPLLDPRVRNS